MTKSSVAAKTGSFTRKRLPMLSLQFIEMRHRSGLVDGFASEHDRSHEEDDFRCGHSRGSDDLAPTSLRRVRVDDHAKDEQRDDVVGDGGADDPLTHGGLKAANIHQDADAHRQRRDRDTESDEDRSMRIEPERRAGACAKGERHHKSHDRDPEIASPERVDELVEVDFHTSEQHQHEEADVGDGGELRRRVNQAEQRRSEDEPCEDLADHGGLAHAFGQFGCHSRDDQQEQDRNDESHGRLPVVPAGATLLGALFS